MSRESRRLNLQRRLEEVLGSRNVYFQPPASISLQYPCVIFSFDDESTLYSNNEAYLTRDKYTVTLITKDPLPELLMESLSSLPYTRFDRHYTADNLHHFTYTTESFERY